jgi:hypothetical protein
MTEEERDRARRHVRELVGRMRPFTRDDYAKVRNEYDNENHVNVLRVILPILFGLGLLLFQNATVWVCTVGLLLMVTCGLGFALRYSHREGFIEGYEHGVEEGVTRALMMQVDKGISES